MRREMEGDLKKGPRSVSRREMLGKLLRKGDNRIVVADGEGKEHTFGLSMAETDSGLRIHAEIAALLDRVKVGETVRIRALQRDDGWVLQSIGKAD